MEKKVGICQTNGCVNQGKEFTSYEANPKCPRCKNPLYIIRTEIASEKETVITGAVGGAIVGALFGGGAGAVLGGMIGSAIGKANYENDKNKRQGGYI